MKKQKKQFMKIRGASEMLGVSPSTLRRWSSKNIVKGVRSYPKAHRKFPLFEIEKFLSVN
jgi:DNA-binding transcriptional MerR regulator